jgi:hypothetical protein
MMVLMKGIMGVESDAWSCVDAHNQSNNSTKKKTVTQSRMKGPGPVLSSNDKHVQSIPGLVRAPCPVDSANYGRAAAWCFASRAALTGPVDQPLFNH